MEKNKRRFQRIPFDAHIELARSSANAHPLTGELLDISLKGALIQLDAASNSLVNGETGELIVRPLQGDMTLTLTIQVAYALSSEHTYGLNFISLDIDSAAHLRRLVEVNLGDEVLLQRELSNLVVAMEAEHQV